ncbi:MAG TPA: hypothetical protein P5555_21385 [Candidatus Paceibacterota bacterium]|nr:hypothetical protein [Verrucomicrobiota bacterium]HRZ47736.1 hypothetical protein [Candidatus Paceibacterota bacterium]HRZ58687.1 hypothetical protein [Candidatus Paceibacterota bacterium]
MKSTLRAGIEPRLVTVIVQVKGWPGGGVAGVNSQETSRSGMALTSVTASAVSARDS